MAKKTRKPKEARKPRQARLPGVEDNRIAPLEDAADVYAEIRDERVALSAKEVEAKDDLLKKMKAAGKTKYKRGRYSIEIKPEGEKLKVKIGPDED